MTTIFGSEVEHEMFSINNGSIMSTVAEARIDKGLFIIFPNNELKAEVKTWHESDPKRYELR